MNTRTMQFAQHLAKGNAASAAAPAREVITRQEEGEKRRLSYDEIETQLEERTASLAQANSILLAEISYRRQVVKSLCEAQEKYRRIFENAVEGIFQSTPQGQYLSVNPAFARIKGYESPEELIADMEDIGQQSYVDPSRRLEFKALMKKYGMVSGFEYETYRKDGSKIWLSMNSLAVRDADGVVLCYEGTVEDITERKRLMEQLRMVQRVEAAGQ